MAIDMSLVGKPHTSSFTYGWKDVVLYALGIGAKRVELDYLYESRGPKVIPSFAVVPTFQPMLDLLAKSGVDLSMIVHGAQRVRLSAPIAPSGTLTTTTRLRGIYDLRKFAVVVIDSDTHVDGKHLFDASSQMIVRGAGGFGGETPPKEEKAPAIPRDRKADFRVEEQTTPEQALLYRLSGDFNPLHADPDFAEKVGFPQGPILHGLATFGHMVRHTGIGLGIDAARITAFEGKFKKPVWPGDILVTEGWDVEPGKVALQVSVKSKDEKPDENVMGGCWASYGS